MCSWYCFDRTRHPKCTWEWIMYIIFVPTFHRDTWVNKDILVRSPVLVVLLSCGPAALGAQRQFWGVWGSIWDPESTSVSQTHFGTLLNFFFSVLSHTVWTALKRDKISLTFSILRLGAAVPPKYKLIVENILKYLNVFQIMHTVLRLFHCIPH